MLNPESVDNIYEYPPHRSDKKITFTDSSEDLALEIILSHSDSKDLGRMLLRDEIIEYELMIDKLKKIDNI